MHWVAFATLSDKDKRRHYDMYGDDEPEPGMGVPRRRRPPGGGVYADEMSPEDIFNMFFGGGYPQQHVRRRTHRRAPPPQDWRQQVAQLIPLLFLCLIMFGNSGSLYDPPFSLKRTAKFRHERLTRSRGVVPDIRYYVADGFSAKHARDGYALRRQEQNVESEYQTHLRYGCFSARQRYSQFKNAAQFSPRRRELMERADAIDMSDCDLAGAFWGTVIWRDSALSPPSPFFAPSGGLQHNRSVGPGFYSASAFFAARPHPSSPNTPVLALPKRRPPLVLYRFWASRATS